MKAKLFCTTGILSGSNYEFAAEATIGKNKINSIVLALPVISDRHARIFFDDAQASYFLEDLGSRNGTLVDGVRVRRREKLDALNIVTFAQKFDFIFQAVDNYERPEAKPQAPLRERTEAFSPAKANGKKTMLAVKISEEDTENFNQLYQEAPRRSLRPDPPQALRRISAQKETAVSYSKTLIETVAVDKKIVAAPPAFLLEVNGIGRGTKTFQLKKGENTLGRSLQSDIEIDNASISRQHAVLAVKSGKVFVKDLGSKNHTYVGRDAVAAEVEIPLGMTLRFGKVEAQLLLKK